MRVVIEWEVEVGEKFVQWRIVIGWEENINVEVVIF